MSLTGRCALLARAVLLAALVVAPAARASGFTEVSASRARDVLDDLRVKLKAPFAPDSVLGQFALVEVQSQSGCMFRVTNPHAHDLWNVEAAFSPEGLGKAVQHLPLLPARSIAYIVFNCGYRGGSYEGVAVGSELYGRKLRDELAASADTELRGDEFHLAQPGYTRAHGALLLLESAKDGRGFVQVLLSSGFGQSAVTRFLTQSPPPGVVEIVRGALAKLTEPRQLAGVLGELVAAPGDRTPAVADLEEELLRRVCDGSPRGGGREAVWLQAARAPLKGALHAAVLARCTPGKESQRRMVQELAGSPELAGPALEATGAATFGPLVEALAQTTAGPVVLANFLRYTADPGRFDTAVALLPQGALPAAVREVAQSDNAPSAAHKAAFMGKVLEDLHARQPEAARALLTELARLQVEGKVSMNSLGAEITSRRSWAEKEIAELLSGEVARRPTVFAFDGGKLPPGVDAVEYLARVQPRLEDCDSSLERLAECGAVLAESKSLAGVPLKPDFLASVSRQLEGADPKSQAFRQVTRHYAGRGLDVEPLTKRLCEMAEREGARREGGEEELLFIAEGVKPGADCVASVRSTRRWAPVVEAFTWTLRGLSVLLPVAGLVLLARWKLRPIVEERQKTLPDVSALVGPGTVTSRLAGPSWPRGLEDALSDARKAFEEDGSAPGRAAAQALSGLREAVPVLAAQAQAVAGDAVSSGFLRSVLIQREGVGVYLVAVPARYEQPQTLRRFPGFAEGWARHVERVARALPADSVGTPLLALVLFVAPDASQVEVVFGLEAGGQRLLPGALLDEREAKRADGRVHPHRGTFALEAAPSPAPVGGGDTKDSK